MLSGTGGGGRATQAVRLPWCGSTNEAGPPFRIGEDVHTCTRRALGVGEVHDTRRICVVATASWDEEPRCVPGDSSLTRRRGGVVHEFSGATVSDGRRNEHANAAELPRAPTALDGIP